MDELERIWENILSREAQRIRKQWQILQSDEQSAVLSHLRRMVSEDGWLEAQRDSARVALDALDTSPNVD